MENVLSMPAEKLAVSNLHLPVGDLGGGQESCQCVPKEVQNMDEDITLIRACWRLFSVSD